jgi:hypothetical protein
VHVGAFAAVNMLFGGGGANASGAQPNLTLMSPADFQQAEPSSLPVMPRPRYRQDPLPLGDCTPPPTLYGPEQALPLGLERVEQGQLGVVPLGPLFEGAAEPETPPSSEPKS